jgi:hypothetical protein
VVVAVVVVTLFPLAPHSVRPLLTLLLLLLPTLLLLQRWWWWV